MGSMMQGTHNKVAREAFQGTDIAMTSFWNATVEMWDFHRDVVDGRGHECSHYCFGGSLRCGCTTHSKPSWRPHGGPPSSRITAKRDANSDGRHICLKNSVFVFVNRHMGKTLSAVCKISG